ncbi:putative RNA polymerase II associated protein 2 [Operophtera brumata]|uniref:RNA polymerase II subunit B1 CTD phosphatase RPAP2 homolog n=1 Tax=Operophtera brumata TaxID=104452 RepID=A0A0L7KNB0_OPEBR|nr:putative RNA polymerase II associated protein 2 [Operophtera brumata]
METNNKHKKKPMKFEEMSKDQIRQALLRKKECNAKAQKIVESLLEEGISEEHLLQCLPDINQAHFDDVFEERAILHLCGYPICQHSISYKDIPKQKYRISLKTNKVYDITARKNFCSNRCYKSAMYVKQQMLTSPLWFREHEVIPSFHLLPGDTAGSMGQEVDLGVIERVKIKAEQKPAFISINDFTSASLNNVTNNDVYNVSPDKAPGVDTELIKTEPQEQCKKDQNENTPAQKDTKPITKDEIRIHATQKPTHKDKKPAPNPTNIVGEIIEKPERKIDPILTQEPEITPKYIKPKKVPQKKQLLVTAFAIEVEKCLAEWFTLDTILFLFGEEKVREMVSDKGELISKYLNNYTKGIFYNSNTYDQYQQLCKKLNMLELEDKRGAANKFQKQMQPLPDYSILQEESKRIQLKVRAYMAGETNIPKPEECEKEKQIEDGTVTQLPLVDTNSQNALRRRIVYQHLNKVLPDLLQSLGLLTLTTRSDVRLLVNTFKLKANNIMYKPMQWTLIALIFIKLLSIRDKRLEYLLEHATAYQHMQLLLLSYKLDGGYLERLISWLTDIDRLLDTNDTQLTLE